MTREFWVYQNGYHEHPWSMMFEVMRIDGQLITNVYVYCELLPGKFKYALILDGLHYRHCWRYALEILKACEKSGMLWSIADFEQLEQSIADIFADCEGMKNER